MCKQLVVPVVAFAVMPFLSSASAREDDKATAAQEKQRAAFVACAQVCGECSVICNACAEHCTKLIANGHKEHLKTQQRCHDCATLCEAAASISARGGPFADLACNVCAEACKRCGDACEQFKSDPEMKRCAEECRKCEKACRDMIKSLAEH